MKRFFFYYYFPSYIISVKFVFHDDDVVTLCRLITCQIMLTNRFDEGLMVLRRLMGWHMIDMTYMTLRVTKVPTRRFLAGQKGARFTKRPSFNELPVEVRQIAVRLPLETGAYDQIVVKLPLETRAHNQVAVRLPLETRVHGQLNPPTNLCVKSNQ